MTTVNYSFLRALDVEGHGGQDVGIWGATIYRTSFGEGFPTNLDDGMVLEYELEDEAPLPLLKVPPAADRREWWQNVAYYRNLRSVYEVSEYLRDDRPLPISVPLTGAWVSPPDGHIADPTPDEVLWGNTHSVRLVSKMGRYGFIFPNSWGGEWGHRGLGSISARYVQQYAFELFAEFWRRRVSLRFERFKNIDSETRLARRDFSSGLLGMDRLLVVERKSDGERLAWAFANELGQNLDVHEFYLRPEFDLAEYHELICTELLWMARKRKKNLRLCVPWADSPVESKSRSLVWDKAARHLGLSFYPSGNRQFACWGVPGPEGSAHPIVTEPHPARAKSPLSELLTAAAAATAVAATVAEDVYFPAAVLTASQVADIRSLGEEKQLRDRLDVINPERIELLGQQLKHQLASEQKSRLDELQAEAEAITRSIYLLHRPDVSRIDAVLESLGDAD